MSAIERVREVLGAAKRLADPRDPLGQELRQRAPSLSGLSPEGVELALAKSLETEASDAELATLLGSVTSAPRAHVVLSANVLTAPARAIALARASSAEVLVKPSRREPVFASLLARALLDAGARGVSLVEELAPRSGDHVHVYGRDETIAAIRAASPRDVAVWGHGAGLGIAAIDPEADFVACARELAEDVVLFDQRGCLSPRVVFVRADESRAEAFARALSEALTCRAREIPIGVVAPEEAAAATTYLTAMSLAGEVFGERGAHVAFDPEPRGLVLPPPPRIVHVVRVEGADRTRALLAPLARFVTAIGGAGSLADALSAHLPLARRSRLGAMQTPPLDGPVDRRSSAPRPRL